MSGDFGSEVIARVNEAYRHRETPLYPVDEKQSEKATAWIPGDVYGELADAVRSLIGEVRRLRDVIEKHRETFDMNQAKHREGIAQLVNEIRTELQPTRDSYR